MSLGSLNGREDGEYNDGDFAEISSIFVTHDATSFGTKPYGNL